MAECKLNISDSNLYFSHSCISNHSILGDIRAHCLPCLVSSASLDNFRFVSYRNFSFIVNVDKVKTFIFTQVGNYFITVICLPNFTIIIKISTYDTRKEEEKNNYYAAANLTVIM